MKLKNTYILIFMLLFGFINCNNKPEKVSDEKAGTISENKKENNSKTDDFGWDDGIEHIEKWAPKTFGGFPLDTIDKLMYEYKDVYEVSFFYKSKNNHSIRLSVWDGEDEYTDPLMIPVKEALDNNESFEEENQKSKVVTKNGIKSIEDVTTYEEGKVNKITFIHNDRYVIIVSGNDDLNTLWNGIAGLPLKDLK